jgi:hypothetical protein
MNPSEDGNRPSHVHPRRGGRAGRAARKPGRGREEPVPGPTLFLLDRLSSTSDRMPSCEHWQQEAQFAFASRFSCRRPRGRGRNDAPAEGATADRRERPHDHRVHRRGRDPPSLCERNGRLPDVIGCEPAGRPGMVTDAVRLLRSGSPSNRCVGPSPPAMAAAAQLPRRDQRTVSPGSLSTRHGLRARPARDVWRPPPRQPAPRRWCSVRADAPRRSGRARRFRCGAP